MPLVDIELIEGVFDHAQKQEMIQKVTDAMVEVEGEAMRGVTWVRVREVASGQWAIGGKALTASDVKALSGVPAITQEPSANPGQTIGIAVPFDPTTAHMVFDVIDSSGNKTTRDLTATQVDLASSKAFFQVPFDAVTGSVVVYGLVDVLLLAVTTHWFRHRTRLGNY